MDQHDAPSPESDAFIQRIEEKSWFAADDTLTLQTTTTNVGEALYSWTTETYIAICQLTDALDDPDVILGDIDPDEEHMFKVNLYKASPTDGGEH